MKAFVWTMVIVIAVDIFGKAIMLWKQDYQRKPSVMAADIFIGLGFLIWGAWVLGGSV